MHSVRFLPGICLRARQSRGWEDDDDKNYYDDDYDVYDYYEAAAPAPRRRGAEERFVPTVKESDAVSKLREPTLQYDNDNLVEYDDEYDPYDDNNADAYYYDRSVEPAKVYNRNKNWWNPLALYEEDDVDEDDDEPYDDTTTGKEPIAGNFWSNPPQRLDTTEVLTPGSSRRHRSPSLPDREGILPRESTAVPHARETRQQGRKRSSRSPRTTFRSGTPPPPAGLSDFYKRLFWYGLDDTSSDEDANDNNNRGRRRGLPDESVANADRTMFGGTKGKFNGLAYLQDGVGVVPKERPRRRPRRIVPIDQEYDDYYDDDEEYNDDDIPYDELEDKDTATSSPADSFRYTSVKPPFDAPRPMRKQVSLSDTRGVYPPPPPRSARRNRNQGDWVDAKVSSWFVNDDDNQYSVGDDDIYDERSSRRQRGSRKSSSPWWQAIDAFLGIDRNELDEQAEQYNRQMGLNPEVVSSSSRSSRSRPRSPRSSAARPPRRKRDGQAYPYENDDGMPPVVEYEVISTEDGVDPDSKGDDAVADIEDSLDEIDQENATKKPDMSWEERALSIERVPPVDIPAWGPKGDLYMNARTKAIFDALEDLNDAREKVRAREKRVELAREKVSILRVDTELERKRLRESQEETKTLQKMIRKLDREVQDASRALRYEVSRLQLAKDELQDLEARHWAVLSFYDADLAQRNVEEAFRELEENEPAVRLQMKTEAFGEQEKGESTTTA